MSKMKQLQQLESNMFDLLQELHHNLAYKQLDEYKLCLVALDELNTDYLEITGKYYIESLRVVTYHEKLWSDFQ